MNRLKPCPFCGSEAEIKKNPSIGWFSLDEDGNFIEGDCGFVFCRNCLIRTEEMDEAKAIEAWNRRDDDAEPVIIHKPTVGEFRRMAMQLGYENVVRCKDCKFGREHGVIFDCRVFGNLMSAEWFCCYGERKEDTDADRTDRR